MMTFAPKRFSYLLTILGGIVLFGSFIGGGVNAQDATANSTSTTNSIPAVETVCTGGRKMSVLTNTCTNCEDNYKKVGENCVKCGTPGVCCGIELNTNVPFIGNCIEYSQKTDEAVDNADTTRVTEETAFPVLMGGLTKILVSVILLVSFIAILVAGVMISASGGSDENASKGKKLIGNVLTALALLGASGVILRLINPNFFQ